jgi:LPXTG-motif cell wall-anchored protein
VEVAFIVTPTQLHDWMQYANIIVQFGILLLLVLGLVFKKKRKYIWHGDIMLLAVIINALLLLSHMGPSLIYLPDEPTFVTVLGIIHAAIGAVAEFLGAWIVVKWWASDSSEIKYCTTKRNLMQKTLILWVTALGLGLIFYVLHTLFE